MRAVHPDRTGTVDRDGVRIAYEVFGGGEQTVLFTPIDPIVDSRAWKAQVPWLSRRARVVTIDPRGNGRSDRPVDPAAYGQPQLVADTVAVMDELGIDAAVLVGICSSSWTALLVAAEHPERVRGLVAISPAAPFLTPPHPWRVQYPDDEEPDTDEGWAKVTNWYLRKDYRGAMEFFFGECAPEPHSSKVVEDCVGWALGTTADLLITADEGPLGVEDRAGTLAVLAAVRCPALVIHGDDDRCQPPARATAIADAIGAEQLTLEGAGHLPMAREPVAVNRAIGAFLDRLAGQPSTPRRWTLPARREKRVLYLSSPIGLGHGRRDLAIADALRQAHPGVRVDWLAQPPLTDWLRRRGETVHPASASLASEAAHIDGLAGEHDLHAFEAIRQMDEILVANFMVFSEIAEAEHFDLWVGDEAWELDHFLYENPELKTTAYAWMTDFVGWLPVTGDCREAELTADYNAEMLDHVARLPRIRDRAIFVGDPQDVVAAPFGPGLPDIRDWTAAHYDFAGYVTGFDPAEIADRTALRESLGFGAEPVCVVAVGGSGAGRHLLQRAGEAYPLLRERRPGLRMLLVTGPRIDPASLCVPAGVEVRGWVPDLHRWLAACDVALVQGGLTTTMELTAAGRPFVYVPLRNHFEQNVHVRHRLARYGAGRCVPWPEASPQRLADELAALVGTAPSVAPVEPGGAARAAALLADLL
jgi:pimeloyl-ACP methyl ester carboxylesterase/predicted glycosyltransferase